MSTPCSVQMYAAPITSSLEDLDGAELDVFYALVIVNPFGPTLTFVASVGKSTLNATLPLVKVMLNPFCQTVEQVGRFTVGDTWIPQQDFEPLIALDYGSCPTLVLVSNQIQEESRPQIVQQIFERFEDDVVRVAASVKRHLGDPWSRVSEAMAGGSDGVEADDPESAAAYLADVVTFETHVKPELQALFYAWAGSIEKTGINDHMKVTALGSAEFERLFLERILPSLWLPEFSNGLDREPAVERPERLKIESLEDVAEILDSEGWRNFSEQPLFDLLRILFFCYGAKGDIAFLLQISKVYNHAVSKGFEENTLMLLENEMVTSVMAEKVLPVVFAPFLLLDLGNAITTKATIDFVSTSGYANGELLALRELRGLFSESMLADRAAVFGALVAMGDEEVLAFLDDLLPQMTTEEVRKAACVQTPFPQHYAIQYWLSLAKKLVGSTNQEDQQNFGACASALILVLEQDSVGRVIASKRNFPCHKSSQAVTIEREWSIEEYAEILAPNLYAIEAAEPAPRLFSDVLRRWGLKPQADLMEQFIPDSRMRQPPDKPLRDLSPKPGASSGGGFLSGLFGRKP
jgi:hypothetical protein